MTNLVAHNAPEAVEHAPTFHQSVEENMAGGSLTVKVSKNDEGDIGIEFRNNDHVGWYVLAQSFEEAKAFHSSDADAANDVFSVEHDEPLSLYLTAYPAGEGRPNPLVEALNHIPAMIRELNDSNGPTPTEEQVVPASKIVEVINSLRDDDDDVRKALTQLISPTT
ncbi:hypothetical protein [Corynebacterium crudilactis]|uniref:Uncharacterized protein n=1 Tax=Corynebacterium crudilactis TaxID=1652495 RepID=A0A172QXQ4_9CORY|nr:hypothetical protein [Corynebacterium crudilactis]ANE05487.1 hypothetical protein ccrud_14190 [Corynebacterium crudilactis]